MITEGVATGVSVFDATGYLTVVAFDAGNLKPVAANIRKLYPDHAIIICADNDASGIGKTKADAAAEACGGSVVMPTKVGYDWNDWINEFGVDDFIKQAARINYG